MDGASYSDGEGVKAARPQRSAVVDDLLRIISDAEQSVYASTLAEYVQQRFADAASYRASLGVDTDMDRSVRAYTNVSDPEDVELAQKTSDIYMPITSTKCHGLQSWVTDILANAEDKPWTIEPTPEPDLPRWLEDMVVERLMQEAMASGITQDFMALAKQTKDLAVKHRAEVARAATKRMERMIQDQLMQSGWRKAFRAFIDDLSVYPSAIMHGPTVEMRETIRWNDGTAEVVEEPSFTVRRVNPKDFYPAPHASTVEDAAYVCEVRSMTVDQLIQMSSLVGVDRDAINTLLAKNQSGWSVSAVAGRPTGGDNGAYASTSTEGPARQYEVIQYYGGIEGRVMYEHGMVVDDIHALYQMEIWVADGIVLRALANPYPLGRKPYHMSSFRRKAGSFWGTSLPTLLRDIQRIGNASARHLVRNMAHSSGPIGEYDVERLVDEDRIEAFDPYRLFAVRPDYTSGGAPAIKFTSIPNNASTFMGVYDRFLKEADDVSGIPAYVIGNPNVAGAGRTLGGLSLLMGNAAKGVKQVIADVDKDIIEPIITTMYQLNLLYAKDERIKADAQVVARGATGLLQRELAQARATEVLPFLMQGLQLGVTDASSIATVMQDMLQGLGYSPDLVHDPKRTQMLQALAQNSAAQGGAQLQQVLAAQAGGNRVSSMAPASAPDVTGASAGVLQPPVAAPVLDGRSAPPADPGAVSIGQGNG